MVGRGVLEGRLAPPGVFLDGDHSDFDPDGQVFGEGITVLEVDPGDNGSL